MVIEEIARISSPFKGKFGIPRQSGLAPDVPSRIIFEKKWQDPEALRGLEGFSHIWLIWGFSANRPESDGKFRPTVRPPRLGGNGSMGVFATRSPFRPNPIGLSCVAVSGIHTDKEHGPVIDILGADLKDGTPIYDIKPYIRYSDCIEDSVCGYVENLDERKVEVIVPDEITEFLGEDMTEQIIQVLENDPRPSYQDDPGRTYGMYFGNYDIHFNVISGILHVMDARKI